MKRRETLQTLFLYGVFACYLLLLAKVLVVSRLGSPAPRALNLIPFHSIGAYAFSSAAGIRRFASANVVGNIVLFMPLGAYLPFFSRERRIWLPLLWVMGASICVEVLQGVLSIGASDIDDVLLNTLGGLIGILSYRVLCTLLRERRPVALAFTVLSALGLPQVLYYLFVVRMRF